MQVLLMHRLSVKGNAISYCLSIITNDWESVSQEVASVNALHCKSGRSSLLLSKLSGMRQEEIEHENRDWWKKMTLRESAGYLQQDNASLIPHARNTIGKEGLSSRPLFRNKFWKLRRTLDLIRFLVSSLCLSPCQPVPFVLIEGESEGNFIQYIFFIDGHQCAFAVLMISSQQFSVSDIWAKVFHSLLLPSFPGPPAQVLNISSWSVGKWVVDWNTNPSSLCIPFPVRSSRSLILMVLWSSLLSVSSASFCSSQYVYGLLFRWYKRCTLTLQCIN